MTNEEKQKLVRWIEAELLCSEDIGYTGNARKCMVVALDALTAQPVKLPKKEKALIGRDYLYVYCAGQVELAIRTAGYEVIE